MLELKNVDSHSIAIIGNLASSIWPVAYKEILSPQQLDYMLQLFYSEEALQQQMSLGHHFVLATQDGQPVGFASYGAKTPDNHSIYRLHKLYLLPSEQGKGTGKKLLEFVVEACKNKSAEFLELNVNKHNTALHFYQHNGFIITASEVIDIGENYVMDDYIMTLKLNGL